MYYTLAQNVFLAVLTGTGVSGTIIYGLNKLDDRRFRKKAERENRKPDYLQ
jgi:hypothetical protein